MKRYALVIETSGPVEAIESAEMVEVPDGEYVSFDDVAALLAVAEAARKVASMPMPDHLSETMARELLREAIATASALVREGGGGA